MNAAIASPAQSLSSVSRVLDFEPTRGHGGRPRLECELEPAIHENVEVAHQHALAWAVEMGLIHRQGVKFDHFRDARFTWLAARAYPHVSDEQLELVADWIAFLFFYDDLCDTQESINPDYLDRLVAAENRLIEIAYGAPVRSSDTPLDRALADIRERAARFASEGWIERLGVHIEEYIEGCRWERIIRLQGQTPSLATYAKLRPLISAVFPCLDFAGMCIDGGRTDFANNVLVQQLEVMANNYVCWVNDIYGVDKELCENTTSNIVIVLAHQYGLDWDAALDRAIEMCNTELAAFLALDRQLALLSHTGSREYVEALKTWMRGNLDWYAETGRYGTEDGEALSACWSTWTRWQSVA